MMADDPTQRASASDTRPLTVVLKPIKQNSEAISGTLSLKPARALVGLPAANRPEWLHSHWLRR
jgi:hypothetical protein